MFILRTGRVFFRGTTREEGIKVGDRGEVQTALGVGEAIGFLHVDDEFIEVFDLIDPVGRIDVANHLLHRHRGAFDDLSFVFPCSFKRAIIDAGLQQEGLHELFEYRQIIGGDETGRIVKSVGVMDVMEQRTQDEGVDGVEGGIFDQRAIVEE